MKGFDVFDYSTSAGILFFSLYIAETHSRSDICDIDKKTSIDRGISSFLQRLNTNVIITY